MKKKLHGLKETLIKLDFSIPGLSVCRQTGELFFPSQRLEKSVAHIVRSLSDMHDVLFDRQILENGNISKDKIVHRIYRTVGDTKDIMEADLKYDITVILPGDWGKQLPTTTGHFHLPVEGSENLIPSPDFYQLISGNILAILQKETEQGTEVLTLSPKIGEWVLIPGEYAHSAVNIGEDPAVFANICVRTPHLTYEPIVEKRGMGIYVIRDGLSGAMRIVRNQHYERIASVAMAVSQPRIPNLESLMHKQSLFNVLNTKLSDLRFLTHPDSAQYMFNPSPIRIVQPL
jgi:oxalate decarboxylase/phosphoglucose isomerase-like protein (cupin superfamily)